MTGRRMPGNSTDRSAQLLLLLLFVVLYIVFLGVRPLFMPDEVRYGEIAREMIATGDWIVPRLNGLLYFEKPPFGHWLNAISLTVFGENPFAVRFASAAATGVSALTVYLLGRHLFSDSRVALLAVFIFLTTFEVQGLATFSVLDAMFSAALNVGIAFFIVAAFASGRRQTAWLVLAGAALGVAFLTKGFLGLVIPVLVMAPWLLVTGRHRLLFVNSWTAVAVAGLVIAPWAIAIHLREPDFWNYFFWVEHVQRFAAEVAQHRQPFYFYLISLPVVAFPWLFLLPAAARALRLGGIASPHNRVILLLALWAILPFVFFSIAKGKMVTYILPCFVPFSLLLAAGLSETKISARLVKIGLITCLLLLSLAVIAIVYISFFAGDVPKYGPNEQGKLLLLVAALATAIAIFAYAGFGAALRAQLIGAGAATALVLAALPWVFPDITYERKAPVEFFKRVYAEAPVDVVVVTDGSLLHAASWALKRADVFVIDNQGETRYGLAAPDAVGRFLSGDDFSRLLASGSDVLLLCKRLCADDTRERLPTNARTSSYGTFSSYLVSGSAAADRSPPGAVRERQFSDPM